MTAEIKFFANINNGPTALIPHELGSGLGFYGKGFGISVPIGTRQETTFVTNANGISEGPQLNNTEAVDIVNDPGTVSINGSNPINNTNLPNFLCPLNIRFTNSTPVRVQNCKLRIFDRNNINNPASGVTTYVYEARHPSTLQSVGGLAHRGTLSHAWETFDPITPVADMIFTSSPGVSGTNTNTSDLQTNQSTLKFETREGPLHSSLRHDWYVAISSEPESIGSKTQYGLYFSVEYL
jgi:hypothetical protein